MVIPFSRQRQQPMQTKDFEQCQLQNVLWANTWPMPMNMIPLYKAYIILNERRLIFHTDVMTKIQMEELQVILNLPQPTRGSGRHWYSVPGTIHQLQVNHQCRPTEPHSLPRIQRDESLEEHWMALVSILHKTGSQLANATHHGITARAWTSATLLPPTYMPTNLNYNQNNIIRSIKQWVPWCCVGSMINSCCPGMTRAAVTAVRVVLKDPSQCSWVGKSRDQCYTRVESNKHRVRAAFREGPPIVGLGTVSRTQFLQHTLVWCFSHIRGL